MHNNSTSYHLLIFCNAFLAVLPEWAPKQAVQCGDLQDLHPDAGLWAGHEQRQPLPAPAPGGVTQAK